MGRHKMGQIWPFLFMLDTPTPRQRPLRLGGPEPRVYELSGPPRRSMLRQGKPLRLGVLVSSVLVPFFR